MTVLSTFGFGFFPSLSEMDRSLFSVSAMAFSWMAGSVDFRPSIKAAKKGGFLKDKEVIWKNNTGPIRRSKPRERLPEEVKKVKMAAAIEAQRA